MAVALSRDERHLFVADYSNHTIRCIDLVSRTVRTLLRAGTQVLANAVVRPFIVSMRGYVCV